MPDTENIKKMLSDMLAKKKADKALEDQQRQEKNDGDRNKILENVGKDFGGIIQPYIDKMGENSRMSAEELKRIIAESVQVTAPNVDTAGIENVISQAFANLKFPEPKVHVAPPVIPAPVIKLNSPEVKFPTSMKLTPNDKPFPVIMMDAGGKPMLFPISGSSGPGFPMAAFDPTSNSIKVAGSFSVTASNSSTQSIDSSGAPYSQANPMPVVFSSSGTTASALVDSSGVQYSGSNPLPTTASLSVPVGQGDSASALRTIQAGDSVSSVVVNSGTITTVTTLTGITNSVAIVQLDRDGNPWQPETFGQGDSTTAMRIIQAGDSVSSVVVNSGTITTVTTLTGITNTVVTRLDSPDGLYSAANPLPVSVASSITQNVTVAGVIDSTFIYQARTTNPTAVADGADVRPKADKLGRTLTRPMQVRDLIRTAYVTLSTGTEATLITAAAGTFYDCIWMAFANTSTAAVQIDVRAVTAGNIVHSAYVPANSTVGWAPPVPWPQDATGNNWTVDMGDFTNSNVLITALFSQEL